MGKCGNARLWPWGSYGYRDFSDDKDGNADEVRNSGFDDFFDNLAAEFKSSPWPDCGTPWSGT